MSKNNPGVSFIVPVYNVEKYLNECVDSLLTQSLDDFEIILVDDGSTDNSGRICDEYALRDERIKVIHKSNAGLGMARNSGLEIATGKYISFIDSDDIVDSRMLEFTITAMERENLDLVRFYMDRFETADQIQTQTADSPIKIFQDMEMIRRIRYLIFDGENSENKKYGLRGSACCVVYRRDIIEEHGLRFVSERKYISEDYIFNFYYYSFCNRIGLLHANLYHYRINQSSLSRVPSLNRLKRIEDFSRDARRMMLAEGFSREESLTALAYYIHGLRSTMRTIFHSSLPLKEKRAWFMEQTASEYLQKDCEEYDFSTLSASQRLMHKAFRSRNFFLSYYALLLTDKLRNKK